MDRALIKGTEEPTELGGADELAPDFERRGLRGDASAWIELAPSVGQRFGDRVCFNRRRLRYGLFRPFGWRIAEPSKRQTPPSWMSPATGYGATAIASIRRCGCSPGIRSEGSAQLTAASREREDRPYRLRHRQGARFERPPCTGGWTDGARHVRRPR